MNLTKQMGSNESDPIIIDNGSSSNIDDSMTDGDNKYEMPIPHISRY
jgi:hypothetical protein